VKWLIRLVGLVQSVRGERHAADHAEEASRIDAQTRAESDLHVPGLLLRSANATIPMMAAIATGSAMITPRRMERITPRSTASCRASGAD
jgi:hypothetical protein